VDPVPDPLLLRKLVTPGIEPGLQFISVVKSNRKAMFTEQHFFPDHIRTFMLLSPWREYTNRIS
jgi:hypothetical protein